MIEGVSCIIITHDRDELLRQSLRSVLEQRTARTLETIVVDDLASESARHVVLDLADEYPGRSVRYVTTSSVTKGASSSRNAGARAASCSVLAFLDDDDTWEPSYVEDACDVLERARCDLVITWMKVAERDGTCVPLLRMPEGLTGRDCLARNPGMTGSNLVVTADRFWSVGGFDSALPVSNDKDVLVRLLLAGCSYAVVERDNATHRRHHGPQLTRPDERRAAGLLLYLDKHRAVMSRADRRFVLHSVHAIRRRTAEGLPRRAAHTALALVTMAPRDVLVRLDPRPQRYGRYRSV